MGVTRWLVRVNPETWTRACALIEERGSALLQIETATRALEDFGREATEEKLAFLEDAEEEPELESTFIASLLEVLVSEEVWDLDKSLTRLESVAKALPGGDVLMDVIDFRGVDIQLPSACFGAESGLIGCCSAARLKNCAAFLESQTPEAAATVLADDYQRTYWSVLRSALLETVQKGHHLGLGISP